MRPPALTCLLPLLALPAPAAAQAVRALQSEPARNGRLPVSPLSGREAALSAKERHGVAPAGRWMAGPDIPACGADGAVVFAHGTALLSVIGASFRACSLRLEPDEPIPQIDLGDSVRWKVAPIVFGSGAAATSVVVVMPSDSGLTTLAGQGAGGWAQPAWRRCPAARAVRGRGGRLTCRACGRGWRRRA